MNDSKSSLQDEPRQQVVFDSGLQLAGAGRGYAEQPRTRQHRPSGWVFGWWAAAVGEARKILAPAAQQEWSLPLLQSLDWKVFENLCTAFFGELGFRAVGTSNGMAGGINIWLYQDGSGKRMGAVQCRGWTQATIGEAPVKDLWERMTADGIGHGVFVTSGVFCKEAHRFAQGRTLELIDGANFVEKLRSLSEETAQQLLREATKGDCRIPSCPRCGAKLVLRTSSATSYWGCRSFPRCSGQLAVVVAES